LKVCSLCKSSDLHRLHRSTSLEFAASWVGFYPYLCRGCKQKGFHIRPRRAFSSYVILTIGLILSLGWTGVLANNPISKMIGSRRARNAKTGIPNQSSVAMVSLPSVLTNEDVTRLANSGMSPASLSWLIRSMPHRFQLDPESRSALKQHGVTEDVIYTMLDVTVSIGYR